MGWDPAPFMDINSKIVPKLADSHVFLKTLTTPTLSKILKLSSIVARIYTIPELELGKEKTGPS